MVIRLPATVVFSAFAAVCMLKFRIGAVISSIRSSAEPASHCVVGPQFAKVVDCENLHPEFQLSVNPACGF
ncbi:hypothetical protein QQP08_004715 [Theobroma cacao]|nr:hypothetical protein QQP08_004715 [Theobroma cacao]